MLHAKKTVLLHCVSYSKRQLSPWVAYESANRAEIDTIR